jgi:cytochrome c2
VFNAGNVENAGSINCRVQCHGIRTGHSEGEISFNNKCLMCRAIGVDAGNKIGPPLNGVGGRKAGAAANFNYSAAMKNSAIVWNEANFREFIADPKAKMPGIKCSSLVLKAIRKSPTCGLT